MSNRCVRQQSNLDKQHFGNTVPFSSYESVIMSTIELKAFAKINWDLHILGKRADGFHELETVCTRSRTACHDRELVTPADLTQLRADGVSLRRGAADEQAKPGNGRDHRPARRVGRCPAQDI